MISVFVPSQVGGICKYLHLLPLPLFFPRFRTWVTVGPRASSHDNGMATRLLVLLVLFQYFRFCIRVACLGNHPGQHIGIPGFRLGITFRQTFFLGMCWWDGKYLCHGVADDSILAFRGIPCR